jgi:hypothetical protein
MKTETVVIEKTCIHCKKPARVEVPREQYEAWRSGVLAQNAFPQLSADEREMIISGTHPECWDAMFGFFGN